jgi:hypothetical protein
MERLILNEFHLFYQTASTNGASGFRWYGKKTEIEAGIFCCHYKKSIAGYG